MPPAASALSRTVVAATVLFVAFACGGETLDVRPGAGLHVPVDGPLPQVARSPLGVVAAAQPLAARAGASMLEMGGNATDAAVAAAFALGVVEPSMGGIGGRVQILIRLPDGTHHGIDGTTQAPWSYDPDTAPQASYGYPQVAVPGVPAGLLRALEEFGTLPRETVLAPAIALAEQGFALLPGEAERQASVAQELAESEGARAVFLRSDGTPRPAGELLVQPELAATLRAIALGGADAFYRGEIAERMAEDITAHGGSVTLEALAAYRAEDARIVRDDYRDYETIGLWIPSFGAITIHILNLLETRALLEADQVEWAVALSEAVRVGYLERPHQDDWSDAQRLVSDDYAAERAALMRWAGPPEAGRSDVGAGWTPDAVAPALVFAGAGLRPKAWANDPGYTSHLTTADGDGMVVALTQTVGPAMGAKVATPGLGFLYAATLGGYLGRVEPGERARSHISPFMVERDGEPFLALGAAGGGRIPIAIAAVVSRVIDQDLSLWDALRAPRIAPVYGSLSEEGDPEAPPEVTVEVGTGLGFEANVLERLRSLGFAVEEVARPGAFGRVHAVRWWPGEGVWEGAADPAWEGAVAVPRGGG